MKALSGLLFFVFSLYLHASDQVAPSSNPVSSGSSTMSGQSDGPLGPNKQEQEEVQERARSMGGAPNMGGGMGTGTGAGSRVGQPTGEGTLNAGAMGAPEEEMKEGKNNR